MEAELPVTVFVRILLCAALTGDGVEQKLPDIAEILLQLILLYLPRYLRKFPPLYLLPRLQLPYSDPAVMDLSVTVFVQILHVLFTMGILWNCCNRTLRWRESIATTNQPTLNPAPAPIAPSPPTDGLGGGDSRLIAYLGNWQPCPSDEQLEQYTHIVIAFAVSYTWSPGKNVCSDTCEIATPPVCENSARPGLIQKWKSMGKKVVLSFGGAGMGGSWAGDNNDCWEHCFGRETQVVNRLTDIVNDMGLDGVDIDYEYFYDDNQNGSGFTKGAKAQKFLKDVTLGLRQSMPEGLS